MTQSVYHSMLICVHIIGFIAMLYAISVHPFTHTQTHCAHTQTRTAYLHIQHTLTHQTHPHALHNTQASALRHSDTQRKPHTVRHTPLTLTWTDEEVPRRVLAQPEEDTSAYTV